MTEKTDTLYSKEYFTDVTQKSIGLFQKYKAIVENEIKLNNINICDIGCAHGNFISQVLENNTCYGFDISEEVVFKCRERFSEIADNFMVLDLNKEALNNTVPQFDLITMFDVIEHLESYTYLRQTLNNKLKRGGYFVITTPNSNSILRFISKNSFTGEIDKTHVGLFTPYTLDFFLRRAGLQKVVLATPFPFYLKTDFLTKSILLGGQIFGIYKKV